MSVKRRSVDLPAHDAPGAITPGPRPRVRNPQGQGGRLRAELIAAADRILAQTGDIEGLSLRAVAREVGIATPSIYLHFPNKSALVRAVLDARFAELGAAVGAAIAREREPFAQLRAGCLAYCRFGTEHPSAYRVLFNRMPSDEAPPAAEGGGPFSLEAGASNFNGLVEGVAACVRAGLVPPSPEGQAADPRHLATSVWTALHGIVSLRGSLPRFPWPPLEQQVEDALTGLLRLHHKPRPSESEASPAGYTSVER